MSRTRLQIGSGQFLDGEIRRYALLFDVRVMAERMTGKESWNAGGLYRLLQSTGRGITS